MNDTTWDRWRAIRGGVRARTRGCSAVRRRGSIGADFRLEERTLLSGGPGLTSVSPSRGIVTGGTEITIIGSNFSSDATQDLVTLDGLAATVDSASPTELVATTPAHPEADVPLIVTVGSLGSNSLTFNYLTLTPAGYYSSDGLGPGTPADPGYYVPVAGSTSETEASPGYYVPDSAATAETAAPAGYYVPGQGATAATEASLGYFVAGAGQSAETPAPAGSYVPTAGATQATEADPGYFVAGAGQSAETPAPAGSYVPTAGATQATEADPGYFVAGAGQSAETPAPAGSYVPTAGATQATEAQPGYFVADPGQSAETPAPAGSYVPTAGATQATEAQPGYYVADPGQSEATPAPAGYYVPTAGATSATEASPGYYVPLAGSSAETPAPAGYYVPTAGATAATEASPGYFVADIGSSAETPAPAGYYVPDPGATAATEASPGYFVAGAGQSAETPAPAGSYVPTAGATQATEAQPGYYVADPGQSEATPAPAGYYVPTAGATSATEASPGYYVPLAGQSAETPAPAGSYVPTAGATAATEASPGYFVAGAGQSAETPAPAGSYVPTAGATQATPASPGFYVPTAGATQQIPDPPFTTSGVAATAPTPASRVVTTTADGFNPFDGVTSLREAIDYANTLSGPQTITFDPSLLANGPVTISLSTADDMTAGPSAFAITGSITIQGPTGSNGLTITIAPSASPMRLFYVAPGAGLTLDDLQLTGGVARGFDGGGTGGSTVSEGGGGGAAGLGGAIFNRGSLTLTADTLDGNSAVGGQGGAGYQFGYGGGGGGLSGPGQPGTLSTAPDVPGGAGGANGGGAGGFTAAGAAGGFGGGGGGGGYANFDGNAPGAVGTSGGPGGFGGGGGGGGGEGSGTALGGTGGFGGGTGGTGGGGGGGGGAGLGGAVFNDGGSVTLVNSTLANNAATGGAGGAALGTGQPGRPGSGLGGAVFSRNGSLVIDFSTLAYNTAAQGGGAVYVLGDGQAAAAELNDTIAADSTGSVSDFASAAINIGSVSTGGSSDLILNNPVPTSGGFSGTATLTGQDPLLAALANYGGPTPTMALTFSSPAINGGLPSAPVTTDQRGLPRDNWPDIGAYEYQMSDVLSAIGQLIPGGTGGDNPLVAPFNQLEQALDSQNIPAVTTALQTLDSTAISEVTSATSGVNLNTLVELLTGFGRLSITLGITTYVPSDIYNAYIADFTLLADTIPGGLTGGNPRVGEWVQAADALAVQNFPTLVGSLRNFTSTAVSEVAAAGSGVDLNTLITLLTGAGRLTVLLGVTTYVQPAIYNAYIADFTLLADTIPGGLTGGNPLVGEWEQAVVAVAEQGIPIAGAALRSFINTAVSQAGSTLDLATLTGLETTAVDLEQLLGIATPILTVTPSLASPLFGQSLSFAAVAANPSGTVPTGTVQFSADGVLLGGPVPVDADGRAVSAGISDLTAGTHTYSAVFTASGLATSVLSASLTVALPAQSVYLLNPSASGALTASGNSSVVLPGGLYVDSDSASAILASGNARVNVGGAVLVVGGVKTSGNAHVTRTGAPLATNDPLSGLPLPSPSGLTKNGPVSVSGNASQTLQPGIYTSIQVSGNAKVTLSNSGSGIYIIKGGGLSVSGNASLFGTGVLIFNAGSAYNGTTDGGTFGSISLGGNGTISLSAPTSGPYTGVALFQSSANTRALALGGNGTDRIAGTVYAPEANVGMSGNAQVTSSMVVSTLSLTGNAGAFPAQAVSTGIAGGAANNGLTRRGNHDVLTGGDGRDSLIGGTGAAALNAGVPDDILIGGWADYDIDSTGMTYDQKLDALDAIVAEWGSADPYATRRSASGAGRE